MIEDCHSKKEIYKVPDYTLQAKQKVKAIISLIRMLSYIWCYKTAIKK